MEIALVDRTAIIQVGRTSIFGAPSTGASGVDMRFRV
jgi:hypothetical protein